MIPIIYEKNEIAFDNNGLGRLRDCISAVVTEERNGVYELEFEYPVTGAHYDEIQLGRIIGVTHDDTDDIQPFDIVGFSKPIDGVVTFHCVHISYRQSYLTVTGSNINSLSDAFDLLATAEPSNPFTYWTNKTTTAYMSAADGTPKSVRSLLGGVEGSILDTYGGEYEWDKFLVKLWAARGQARDFTIRYGVNMLNYNDDMDSEGTYQSVVPYWTDGTTTIIGDRVDSAGITVANRGECVPLDLSDKFETTPTKSQVESMAATYLAAHDPYIPKQTIHVEFARLQDLGYEEYSALLQCRLCDTIEVIFPDYATNGQFKIVKTVYNVLMDRFDSMELGDLSVSLSEALGIGSSSGSVSSGGGPTTVTVNVNSTTTGAPGTNASVTNSGDEVNVALDFVIPRGATGETGQTGPQGPTGPAAGFGTPTASVDANVGTPSVSVTASGADTAKVFDFAFHNLKGETGQTGQTGAAAGFGTVTATVDSNVGTPSVTVTTSGTDTAKNFAFAFHNLKGEQGDAGQVDTAMSDTSTLPVQNKVIKAYVDAVWDMIYPIGSYYETSDTSFNPNATWGGTWILETEGQVHVSGSANGTYQVSGALTNTTDGGEATHQLTVQEMPSHSHTWRGYYNVSGGSTGAVKSRNKIANDPLDTGTDAAGGNQAHNNMQPYIIVNRWHRTA